MRLIADLVMTTSLSAMYSPTVCAVADARARASIMRSSMAMPPARHRLQRRQHLVERGRGEEAEAAEVDAEDRHAEVADRAGHRQQRAVAAEHDEEIDLAGKLGLAGRRHRRRRHEAGGFLLEHRRQPVGGQPVHAAGG